MGECAKSLGPDDPEVAEIAKVDLGEDSVEDITEKMATETCYDCLAAHVAV